MRKFWVVVFAMLFITLIADPVLASQDTYNGYQVVNVVVEGRQVKGDVPAIIMDGRTLIPLRVVGEALGVEMKWDGNANTVNIITNKKISNEDELKKIIDNWISKRDLLIDVGTRIINSTESNVNKRDKLYNMYLSQKSLLKEILSFEIDPNNTYYVDIEGLTAYLAGDILQSYTAIAYFNSIIEQNKKKEKYFQNANEFATGAIQNLIDGINSK